MKIRSDEFIFDMNRRDFEVFRNALLFCASALVSSVLRCLSEGPRVHVGVGDFSVERAPSFYRKFYFEITQPP